MRTQEYVARPKPPQTQPTMNRIELAGTGPEFVSQGIREIESLMEELITGAQTEIQILAYVFTESALPLIDTLGRAAARGVRITLVLNRLNDQNPAVINKIGEMQSMFPAFKVVNFEDRHGSVLHAKVVVSDRKKAVVGSANFTMGGMTSNYELGIFLEGDVAWKLSNVIDTFAEWVNSRNS